MLLSTSTAPAPEGWSNYIVLGSGFQWRRGARALESAMSVDRTTGTTASLLGVAPSPHARLGSGNAAAAARARQGQSIIVVMHGEPFVRNITSGASYVPGGPYHRPPQAACRRHRCVDGLAHLEFDRESHLVNSNPEDAGLAATAFHNPSRCVIPDLAHAWRRLPSRGNFEDPTRPHRFPNDGFVE